MTGVLKRFKLKVFQSSPLPIVLQGGKVMRSICKFGYWGKLKVDQQAFPVIANEDVNLHTPTHGGPRTCDTFLHQVLSR